MERVPIRLGKLRTTVTDSTAVSAAIQLPTYRSAESDNAAVQLIPTSLARICRVCTQNASRYTCPRCNAPYCSVACYKAHGEGCTEQFYEAHVKSEIQLTSNATNTQEQQQQMNQLLERVKAFQDDLQHQQDEAEASTLTERLEQLALMEENELSLDHLTAEERAQFLAAVVDGRLSRFVTLWQPWWLLDPQKYERETSAKRRQLIIEEISTASDPVEAYQKDSLNTEEELRIETPTYPSVVFTKKLEKMMPKGLESVLGGATSPSPYLPFHLIEILFAYALVMRAFNGDWHQDVADAVEMLLHLCCVLNEDAKYQSVEHVVQACLEKRIETAIVAERNLGILHDVTMLLKSKLFILDALTDTRAMVQAYIQEITDEIQKKGNKKENKDRKRVKKQVEKVDRKLAFYQMWVFHTTEEFQLLAAQAVFASTHYKE